MIKGQKLVHKDHGTLTVTKKAYSPVDNKVVWKAIDSSGKEFTLDGTEKDYKEKVEAKKSEQIKAAKDADSKKEKESKAVEEEAKEIGKAKRKERLFKKKMGEVKEAIETTKTPLEAIVEAVKAIPKTVVNIPDHYEEQKKWQGEIVKILEKETNFPETDLQPVIAAIKGIRFPETKFPEQIDYTLLLQNIEEALPENADMSGVISAINAIPLPAQYPFKFNKDGELMVQVDRTASGQGGGGLSSADSQKLTGIEEKLSTIISQGVPVYDNQTISYVASGNGVGEPEIITYILDGSPVRIETISYDSSNRPIGIIIT